MRPEYYTTAEFEALHFKQPLTYDEERKLLVAWQIHRQVDSRDELVRHFALYVSRLAHKFAGPIGRRPDMIGDCIGVANEALLRSANDFDLARGGVRFISLVYLRVRREVIRHMQKTLRGARPNHEDEGDSRTSFDESGSVGFVYPDEPGDEAEGNTDHDELLAELAVTLPLLPWDEFFVLQSLFFLGHNLTVTGKHMDPVCSQSEVRRLKESGLARLRTMLTE